MSKPRKTINRMISTCVWVLVLASTAAAQFVEATVTIDPVKRSASVAGNWGTTEGERRNLSFLRSSIGSPELGSRISGVSLTSADGRPVGHRKFDSAEYVGDSAFHSFRYEVDLRPASNARASAHTSWLAGDHGLIYLEDILPLAGTASKSATVGMRLPQGWRGSYQNASTDKVRVENVERAIWVIGQNLSETRSEPGRRGIATIAYGQWLFSEAELSSTAAEIYAGYERSIGALTRMTPLVVILPFPQANVAKGTWEAETRGDTVIVVSSDTHFKGQSLQRLHEQLRHEIFHLWIPNGVALTGNYDWFYEGFALYQSLRMGVLLNRIRFEDMLDTLSRAHAIDSAQTRRLSLIDVSKERWAGAETSVYARGMLVAFICDLVLLQSSGGKKGVDTLIKQLFSAHRGATSPVEGNAAVLKVLSSNTRLSPVLNNHITGVVPVDMAPFLEAAGIELDPGTSGSRLRIKSKLSGPQKSILDELGYNNWRKLARK